MKLSVILIIFLVLFSSIIGQHKNNFLFEKSNLKVGEKKLNLSFNDKQTPSLNLAASSSKKGKGKALLLSILLPGAGEYYLGHKKMAKIIMGMDLTLWGGFFGSHYLKNQKESDYKTLARQKAGVQKGSFDAQYWIQVGNYNDIYSNNKRELINRRIYLVYSDTEKYYWNWKSVEDMNRFNKIRIDASRYSKLKDKFYMGLFINRLVSVMNVLRIMKNNKKVKKISYNWNVNYNYSIISGDCMSLTFTKSF